MLGVLASQESECMLLFIYCCPVKVLQDKKNKAETLLQDSSLFCYFACCKKR